MFVRVYIDHLEFRYVRPKLEVTRRCFESRSINKRFAAKAEGGRVLYLTQLKSLLKSILVFFSRYVLKVRNLQDSKATREELNFVPEEYESSVPARFRSFINSPTISKVLKRVKR